MTIDKDQYKVRQEPFYQAQGKEVALYEAAYAARLPGFFENLGHGNVINTAGGGAYGHIDSPAAGAKSLRQAYECWQAKADPIEWAKEHPEFARAFVSFPKDADQIYPGWREKLGVHK